MSSSFAFVKLEGCGNDFVVCSLKDIPESFLKSPAEIKKVCDRNFGIGSDGLLVVDDQDPKRIEVLMFNPDGSSMGMCGNGIRCVVRYLCLHNSNYLNTKQFSFTVSGRNIDCITYNQGLEVQVDMGPPNFAPELVFGSPFIPLPPSTKGFEVALNSKIITGWPVFMGNPHFVTFVDELDTTYAKVCGSELENNIIFANRSNIEFVRVSSPQSLEILVWERGAGLTLACGTGACAAVVASIRLGKVFSPCKVSVLGGALEVKWDPSAENAKAYLKGPAKEVFSGTYLVS